MKKIITLLITLVITLTVTKKTVEAGAVGGGATEVTQIANKVELIPVNINGLATSIATKSQQFFTVVMGPIANALINNMLQNATQDIITWAKGGFSGEGPQFLQNPESFIKKAVNNEARKALAAIPSSGAMSDAAFATIRDSLLNENKSLDAKVKASLASQLPYTIQSNICKESRLTELSLERSSSPDGKYDTAAVLVEKEYLYGYFCSCNPSDDDACAAKLMDAYEQRPELGGGQAWLQLTGGDNMFTRVTKTDSVVAEHVATTKKRAENELYFGLGAVSETKCLDERTDGAGFTYCDNSVVVNPGKAIQSTIETALNAPFLRLTNIQGEGTFGKILGTLTLDLLSKGLMEGLSALSAGSNSSETVSSVRPVVNDLVNDPERKESTVGAIINYFKVMEQTLTDLEEVDRDYDASIKTYKAKVAQVKTCFDSLIERGVVLPGDSRVVSAYNYHNSRMSKITSAESIINEDLIKIAAARDLINTTKITLANTQSSQVISDAFNSFKSRYSEGNFPDNTTFSTRSASFAKDKAEADRDTERDDHLNSCNQIEAGSASGQNAY